MPPLIGKRTSTRGACRTMLRDARLLQREPRERGEVGRARVVARLEAVRRRVVRAASARARAPSRSSSPRSAARCAPTWSASAIAASLPDGSSRPYEQRLDAHVLALRQQPDARAACSASAAWVIRTCSSGVRVLDHEQRGHDLREARDRQHAAAGCGATARAPVSTSNTSPARGGCLKCSWKASGPLERDRVRAAGRAPALAARAGALVTRPRRATAPRGAGRATALAVVGQQVPGGRHARDRQQHASSARPAAPQPAPAALRRRLEPPCSGLLHRRTRSAPSTPKPEQRQRPRSDDHHQHVRRRLERARRW